MKQSSILVALAVASTAGAQLSSLESHTLQNHPEIAAAAAEARALRARGAGMNAPFRPMISATGVGAFGNDSAILAGTVEPISYLMATPDPIGIGSIMAMWKIYSGGRDRTAAESARTFVALGDAQVAVARLDVLRDVRVAYAEALAAEGELDARFAGVKAAEELLRVTEKRFIAGSAPEAFVLKAKADASRAGREHAMAKAKLQSAIAMLKEAAGKEHNEPAQLGEWDVSFDVPKGISDAIELAKHQRPELQAAKARKRGLQLQGRAARQSAYPELNVFAMGTGMATETESEVFYKVGLVVSVPIIDGGIRSAEAAEMKAMEQGVEQELRSLELQVGREVASSWASWEASPEVLGAADAEVESAHEAYRIALLRYTEGKAPQVEVEQASADLVAALAGRAEANAFRQIAWSNLMRAVGDKNDQEDQSKS